MQRSSALVASTNYSALHDQEDSRNSAEHAQPGGLKGSGSQSSDIEIGANDEERIRPAKYVPLATRQAARSQSLFIWWAEATCCVLIVCGLMGIVATIGFLDNKPLPHWPYRLSVNTLIAAFSVLIKAACGLVLAQGISHIKWTNLRRPQSLHNFEVHDEASRGPWGALVLLWNDCGRTVSSLGAFVTILILFLEPFSQQIVSFRECVQTYGQETATIPKTNFYDAEETRFGELIVSMPWKLRKLVNQAMYATEKPGVSFDCATGNCTFAQEYSTLGFCSRCHDLTEKLIRETNNGASEQKGFVPSQGNITLPPWVTDGTSVTLMLDAQSQQTVVDQTRSSRPRYPILAARGMPSIGVIRMVDFESSASVAYLCDILPCVKTYAVAEVSRSVLHEELKREYILPANIGQPTRRVVDLDCLDTAKKNELSEMGYDLSKDNKWLKYNVTIDYDQAAQRLRYHSDCYYVLADQIRKYCDNRTVEGTEPGLVLKEEYAEIVPAECVYSMNYIAGTTVPTTLFDSLIDGMLSTPNKTQTPMALSGSEALMAIWNAGSGNGTLDDFSGFVNDISNAMTTYIRQNGNQYQSDPVLGEVQYSTICIHVRWPWIAYSGAIVGFTLSFFVWVVLQAKRDQLRLLKTYDSGGDRTAFHDLKSSSVAVLFHGLDESSQRKLADVGSTNRQKELARLSKTTEVQLVATEQGWKLSIT